MSLRRIFAILLKDLRDAGRDGRILVLLALPIGMAVFYNATIGDDDELPETKVAVVERAGGKLAGELRVGDGQERQAAPALASSPGVRAQARRRRGRRARGRRARGRRHASALVLVSPDASPTAQSVVALVPDAVARAAGPTPAARTQVAGVAPANQKPTSSSSRARLRCSSSSSCSSPSSR